MRAQGLYDQAKSLNERSLDILKKAFGEDHPDFATALNNLALALYDKVRCHQMPVVEPLFHARRKNTRKHAVSCSVRLISKSRNSVRSILVRWNRRRTYVERLIRRSTLS